MDYTPPEQHGLQNSEQIIPSYYKLHLNPHKIVDLNYFVIIKDDVRNFRTLNKRQLTYIKQITEEKHELIVIFNSCLQTLIDTID